MRSVRCPASRQSVGILRQDVPSGFACPSPEPCGIPLISARDPFPDGIIAFKGDTDPGHLPEPHWIPFLLAVYDRPSGFRRHKVGLFVQAAQATLGEPGFFGQDIGIGQDLDRETSCVILTHVAFVN